MRPPNIVLAILALVFLLNIKLHEACRVLDKEWMKNENLLLLSLARGSVPPSRPDGGTHIPASTINEKGFASHAMPPPLVDPQLIGPFGVAKN
ncbi:hypothetical protein ACSBR2_032106 [Camellia fascicularis]